MGISHCANPPPFYDRTLSYIFFVLIPEHLAHLPSFCLKSFLLNLPNQYSPLLYFSDSTTTSRSTPFSLQVTESVLIHCTHDQVSPNDTTFLSLFMLRKELTIQKGP